MKYKPTAIDLFCGPGGLSLGFRKAGFKILLGIDNEKSAVKTFKRNQKGADVIEEDIRKLAKNFSDVEEKVSNSGVDIIIGGPMCKGFSIANLKTRGMSNPYNSLHKYFVKFVAHFKPKCFVMENVPGILPMGGGKIKDRIVKSFRRAGYHIKEPIVLDAVNFGVPQKRRRVFFIGFADQGIELVFGANGHEYVSVGGAISDLPRIPNGGGGNRLNYRNKATTEYQNQMRGKCKTISNHTTTKSRQHVVERFKRIRQGKNWEEIKGMLNYKNVENTHSMIYKRLEWKKPAVTIANFRKSMLIHPRQNRLLSVREAARLQSFPDSYVFEGGLNSVQQQVADAVPPLLAKAVAIEVMKHLN